MSRAFLACDTGGNIAVRVAIQNSDENIVLQKNPLFRVMRERKESFCPALMNTAP